MGLLDALVEQEHFAYGTEQITTTPVEVVRLECESGPMAMRWTIIDGRTNADVHRAEQLVPPGQRQGITFDPPIVVQQLHLVGHGRGGRVRVIYRPQPRARRR